jgi:hypothetical protein
MKRFLISLTIFVSTLGFAADQPAPSATPAPKTPAQQALSDAMAVARERPVNHPKLFDLYLDFLRKFPDADREISRITGELPKLVRNPTAEDAGFVADYHLRLTEAIASPDYGDKAHEALMTVDAMLALGLNGPGAPVDAAAARLKLDAFFARYPKANNWAYLETEYAKLLGKTDSAAEVAHLKKTEAAANHRRRRSRGGSLQAARQSRADRFLGDVVWPVRRRAAKREEGLCRLPRQGF